MNASVAERVAASAPHIEGPDRVARTLARALANTTIGLSNLNGAAQRASGIAQDIGLHRRDDVGLLQGAADIAQLVERHAMPGEAFDAAKAMLRDGDRLGFMRKLRKS